MKELVKKVINTATSKGYELVDSNNRMFLLKKDRNTIDIWVHIHPKNSMIVIQDYLTVTINGNPIIVDCEEDIELLKF